jgi:hypothetical protein
MIFFRLINEAVMFDFIKNEPGVLFLALHKHFVNEIKNSAMYIFSEMDTGKTFQHIKINLNTQAAIFLCRAIRISIWGKTTENFGKLLP